MQSYLSPQSSKKILTEEDVETIVTRRILKYHNRLVRDFILKENPSKSCGGTIIRCKGGPL